MSRAAIRTALITRDQLAFARALGQYRDTDKAERVAVEELVKLDAMTRAWWAQPQEGCDGVNCLHDHATVREIIDGWMEGDS